MESTNGYSLETRKSVFRTEKKVLFFFFHDPFEVWIYMVDIGDTVQTLVKKKKNKIATLDSNLYRDSIKLDKCQKCCET